MKPISRPGADLRNVVDAYREQLVAAHPDRRFPPTEAMLISLRCFTENVPVKHALTRISMNDNTWNRFARQGSSLDAARIEAIHNAIDELVAERDQGDAAT